MRIKPLAPIGRFAVGLMYPLSLFASGTVWERPKQTHFWTVAPLLPAARFDPAPDPDFGVRYDGKRPYRTLSRIARLCKAVGILPLYRAWKRFQFHVPILGGSCTYTILRATTRNGEQCWTKPWHICWKTGSTLEWQYSRIPITRRYVRMALGDRPVTFCALAPDGTQIGLKEESVGTIGKPARNKDVNILFL